MSTEMELCNLKIDLAKVKKLEQDFEALQKNETATLGDLRKARMELDYHGGKLNQAAAEFMRKEGLPEQGHHIDLISHFFEKGKKTLVMAG